jgi:hexosaminidase
MNSHRTAWRRVLGAVAAAAVTVPLAIGQATAAPLDVPSPSPEDASVNLALLDGAVASAASQRQTPPAATYAPANAIDVFTHNGWTSNYASVGDGYDHTNDWFQVRLAEPAPVYEVFIRWTSPDKPSAYDLQVSTDAECTSWTTVKQVTDPADNDSQVIDSDEALSCVRMQATATSSTTGYTINEFELWSGPKPPAVVGRIIPVPVSQTPGTGEPWQLTAQSRIVVSEESLVETADLLAESLRPSTGYELPVVTGEATAADIALRLDAVDDLPEGDAVAAAEGYALDVSDAGAVLTAPTAHGLFNGFQSLRQLLPAASFADVEGAGPWTVEPISVLDYPRYAHRGLQLDPARNFLTVEEVKSMIDQMVALKASRLHMHLTDSQSWRLEIKGYPELDGAGCSGSNCLSGFYTQEDFSDIVAYANARFIEVVPEVESPAHATAAVRSLGGVEVMGCAGQTQTDRFCTDPDDPASARALAFWDDVIEQLAELSPGPIIHIGGDEAIGMDHDDYMWWIRQMEILVNSHGKRMMGWNPAIEGYAPDSTSINHYWSDYTGGGPALIKPEWFDHGRDVIVTPEWNVYLDFGYDTSPGRTPRTELAQSYGWDPEWVYEKYRRVWAQPAYGGPRAEDILGIEAPIWGEQMRGLATNEFMVFPRLAGILEIAWSPKTHTQDLDAYRQRLSVAGARWAFSGVNYGSIRQVDWTPEAMGTVSRFGADRTVDDAVLARLSAGSISPTELSAVIDWGDGSAPQAAEVVGRDYTPSTRTGRSLATVSGTHTYADDVTYHGTVTYTRGEEQWEVPFVVEPDPVAVDVEVTSRCVVGSVYLVVRTTNVRDASTDVTVTTPFGERSVVGVRPDARSALTFAVRQPTAGAGTVSVRAQVGTAVRELSVPYDAVTCG